MHGHSVLRVHGFPYWPLQVGFGLIVLPPRLRSISLDRSVGSKIDPSKPVAPPVAPPVAAGSSVRTSAPRAAATKANTNAMKRVNFILNNLK